MVKNYSFYFITYRLFSSVLGGRILVRCVLHAGVLFSSHVCNYCFFHRYLSHKTFQTSRIVQFIFVLIGTMSAQRGPLWWAAHHRYHHHFTDTDQDPHSAKAGFWYSHVGWFLNEQNFATRKKSH